MTYPATLYMSTEHLNSEKAVIHSANTFVLSPSEELLVKKYRPLPPLSQETLPQGTGLQTKKEHGFVIHRVK